MPPPSELLKAGMEKHLVGIDLTLIWGLRTHVRCLLKHWCSRISCSFRGEQRKGRGVGGVNGFLSSPCMTVAVSHHCAKQSSHSLTPIAHQLPAFLLCPD